MDSLEKGMLATHSSVLARRIPWTRKTWQATVHRVPKSRSLSLFSVLIDVVTEGHGGGLQMECHWSFAVWYVSWSEDRAWQCWMCAKARTAGCVLEIQRTAGAYWVRAEWAQVKRSRSWRPEQDIYLSFFRFYLDIIMQCCRSLCTTSWFDSPTTWND